MPVLHRLTIIVEKGLEWVVPAFLPQGQQNKYPVRFELTTPGLTRPVRYGARNYKCSSVNVHMLKKSWYDSSKMRIGWLICFPLRSTDGQRFSLYSFTRWFKQRHWPTAMKLHDGAWKNTNQRLCERISLTAVTQIIFTVWKLRDWSISSWNSQSFT